MAGTVITTISGSRQGRNNLQVATITWTCDASGDATADITSIKGTIERIVYNPSDSSGFIPTEGYTITLLDVDSVDVLNGTAASLKAATVLSTISTEDDGTTYRPMAINGTLSLVVSDAGDITTGSVKIYFRN